MNANKGDRMNAGSNPAQPVREMSAAEALRQVMLGQAGPMAAGWTGLYDSSPAAPSGKRVLILGAGIAGLTAAYELSKQGYKCTLLEAQDRVGGRNRTGRKGDVLYEVDEEGNPEETHTCAFDDGLYLNLGPGRIPYHHRRVLKYCTDFGVKLEPYIMETTANVISLSEGTTRWRNGQVANDTRGHLAAFLGQAAFFAEKLIGMDAFTGEVRDLLRVFGDLAPSQYGLGPRQYEGTTRSGYDLTINQPFPEPNKPLDFQDLVESHFWSHYFYQPVDYLWQATMFQPVGGMDKIVEAFSEKIKEIEKDLGKIVYLKADVSEIALRENDVRVVYTQSGQKCDPLIADYCISSIPLPILQKCTLKNFSRDFKKAISSVGFASTCKVGWQANERFWENDSNQIYGGISWTDHNITQIWYPSYDYFSAKGTLTGAYNYDHNADVLGRMLPSDRLKFARKGARQVHPEFGNNKIVPLAKGVSIAWHKVPYQLGGWAGWDPGNADHPKAYKRLLQGESASSDETARFFVIGDQASPLPGWIEGAMMSAEYAAARINGVTRPVTMSDVVEVPNSAALTQGPGIPEKGDLV